METKKEQQAAGLRRDLLNTFTKVNNVNIPDSLLVYIFAGCDMREWCEEHNIETRNVGKTTQFITGDNFNRSMYQDINDNEL